MLIEVGVTQDIEPVPGITNRVLLASKPLVRLLFVRSSTAAILHHLASAAAAFSIGFAGSAAHRVKRACDTGDVGRTS